MQDGAEKKREVTSMRDAFEAAWTKELGRLRKEHAFKKETGTVCKACGHGERKFKQVAVFCDGECSDAEIPLGQSFFESTR
ncbi:unnamed protein product, partial [Ectocarpus sp. 4 AP-2014]